MDEPAPPRVPRGRLVAYYALLVAVVGAVVVLVLAVVPKPKAQPNIAGGYDLVPPKGCLGKQVNLSPSGEIADLEHVQGNAGGSGRSRHGRTAGTGDGAGGGSAQLDVRARKGALAGAIGG